VEIFAFFFLATVIALSALLVVAFRNPVYSVISLLVMFFHIAALFVSLHAEFLAAVQIIVYAGAILVLYLFVVMLLNLKHDDSYQRQVWIGVGIGGVALAEIIYLVVTAGSGTTPSLGGGATLGGAAEVASTIPQGNTETIGRLLYTKYLFPFEVASLILLVAMIGAILLAKKGIVGFKEE
jgi:NADH-quinone oxidoreductase subunit J